MLNSLMALLPIALAEGEVVTPGFDVSGAVNQMVQSVDFTIFATIFVAVVAVTIGPSVTMAVIRKAKGWLLGAIKGM